MTSERSYLCVVHSLLKMKLLVLFVIIASARARLILDDSECGGIVIRNIKQEKQVLKTNIEYPYQLAIDYDTNTLFFSYSAHTDEVFKSAYIELKTNKFGIISGINGGFANAVDDKSNTVYLGGRDGIYKFDVESKRAVNLHLTSDNIWQLFYKNDLYYTNYENEKAYRIIDGVAREVEELKNTRAMLVAVDNSNNIYFSNSSGLYRYEQATKDVALIGTYVVNGITTDIQGDIYFSTPDGIYYINGKAKQIETLTILSESSIYGLAVESNGNIIYAYDSSIVRLNPTEKRCFSNTEIKGFGDNKPE